MPRLTKQQVDAMRVDREGGMSVGDIMGKYGVSKRAVYYNTTEQGKRERDPTLTERSEDFPDDTSEDDVIQQPTTRKVSFEEEEDPLIDFGKMKEDGVAMQVRDDNIFHVKDDIDDVFNIDNILTHTKPDIPDEPKLSVSKLVNGLKSKSSKSSSNDNKAPEDVVKEKEQARLKLVYQVRLYLYTFKDCENLFLALNVEQNNDKKINKFIQDLYRRKEVELVKLLDFIKFHIRHSNNMIQGNFVSGVFFTITKILELILFKFGVNVVGLTDDLRADKDIISNLKEIEIEMTAGRINVGPKTDVMFKLCQTALSKFTHNKLVNKMEEAGKKEKMREVMDKLQAKPVNVELQEKYKDI